MLEILVGINILVHEFHNFAKIIYKIKILSTVAIFIFPLIRKTS